MSPQNNTDWKEPVYSDVLSLPYWELLEQYFSAPEVASSDMKLNDRYGDSDFWERRANGIHSHQEDSSSGEDVVYDAATSMASPPGVWLPPQSDWHHGVSRTANMANGKGHGKYHMSADYSFSRLDGGQTWQQWMQQRPQRPKSKAKAKWQNQHEQWQRHGWWQEGNNGWIDEEQWESRWRDQQGAAGCDVDASHHDQTRWWQDHEGDSILESVKENEWAPEEAQTVGQGRPDMQWEDSSSSRQDEKGQTTDETEVAQPGALWPQPNMQQDEGTNVVVAPSAQQPKESREETKKVVIPPPPAMQAKEQQEEKKKVVPPPPAMAVSTGKGIPPPPGTTKAVERPLPDTRKVVPPPPAVPQPSTVPPRWEFSKDRPPQPPVPKPPPLNQRQKQQQSDSMQNLEEDDNKEKTRVPLPVGIIKSPDPPPKRLTEDEIWRRADRVSSNLQQLEAQVGPQNDERKKQLQQEWEVLKKMLEECESEKNAGREPSAQDPEALSQQKDRDGEESQRQDGGASKTWTATLRDGRDLQSARQGSGQRGRRMVQVQEGMAGSQAGELFP